MRKLNWLILIWCFCLILNLTDWLMWNAWPSVEMIENVKHLNIIWNAWSSVWNAQSSIKCLNMKCLNVKHLDFYQHEMSWLSSKMSDSIQHSVKLLDFKIMITLDFWAWNTRRRKREEKEEVLTQCEKNTWSDHENAWLSDNEILTYLTVKCFMWCEMLDLISGNVWFWDAKCHS